MKVCSSKFICSKITQTFVSPPSFWFLFVMDMLRERVFFLLNFTQNLQNVSPASLFCVISCCILIGLFVDVDLNSSHIVRVLLLDFLWSPKLQIGRRWTRLTVRSRTPFWIDDHRFYRACQQEGV